MIPPGGLGEEVARRRAAGGGLFATVSEKIGDPSRNASLQAISIIFLPKVAKRPPGCRERWHPFGRRPSVLLGVPVYD